MATASKLKEDYLTCVICYELYTNPATLQCDHTFCRPCLLKYTKTHPEAVQAKSIPCPVCRRMTKVTSPDTPVEDWVNQVKLSRIMQGLMDDFGTGTGRKNHDTCSVCGEEGEITPATVWCSDCQAAFCDNCARYHRRMPTLRNHDVHGLSDDINFKPTRRFVCRIHEDEVVKLLCKDCKKAICHTCCSISHRTCKTVLTIKETLPEITSSLLARKQTLDKHISHKSKRINEQNSQIDSTVQQINEVGSEIKTASNKAVELIISKEKMMTDELNKIKLKQVGELKAGIKTDEITKQVYQQQSQFIDQAVKSECQRDIFDMYERCQSEVSEDEANADSLPKKTNRIGFKWDRVKLSKAIDEVELGEMYEIETGYVGRGSSPVLLRTIDTKVKQDTGVPDLFDVILINHDGVKVMVVADWGNSSIKTFYTEDNQPRHSVLKLDGKPFGITAVGKDQVFVTTPRTKKIYNISAFPKARYISTITTNNMYTGIDYIDSNKLVVCSMGKSYLDPHVDILDMKGTVLKSVRADDIKGPVFVCQTNKGIILVSDSSIKSLIFISLDRQIFNTYTPTGDRDLQVPRGITTTRTGDILLVDMDASKVIQLTPSQEFVRDILTSADGLEKPKGIAIDEDGLVYVTCGQYVNVFKFRLSIPK